MGRMSELAAYLASIEALYPQLSLYGDGDERAALLGQQEAWLADEAGQREWNSWLDQINAQSMGDQK